MLNYFIVFTNILSDLYSQFNYIYFANSTLKNSLFIIKRYKIKDILSGTDKCLINLVRFLSTIL